MGPIAVWHKIPVKNVEDIHSSEIYKTKWNSTCYKSLKSHKIVNSFVVGQQHPQISLFWKKADMKA